MAPSPPRPATMKLATSPGKLVATAPTASRATMSRARNSRIGSLTGARLAPRGGFGVGKVTWLAV